jgi:hypothetical protein
VRFNENRSLGVIRRMKLMLNGIRELDGSQASGNGNGLMAQTPLSNVPRSTQLRQRRWCQVEIVSCELFPDRSFVSAENRDY